MKEILFQKDQENDDDDDDDESEKSNRSSFSSVPEIRGDGSPIMGVRLLFKNHADSNEQEKAILLTFAFKAYEGKKL